MIIVHHHFRPGGVRRVIELATPHLVAHWPEPIRVVVLAAGKAPEPAWLRTFRKQLHGTSVKVVVHPAFGYVSEFGSVRGGISRRVMDAITALLREAMHDDILIWAHNLGLGRNIDEALRMVDALQFTEKHGEVCPAGWNKGKAGMKASTSGVAEYLASHAKEL